MSASAIFRLLFLRLHLLHKSRHLGQLVYHLLHGLQGKKVAKAGCRRGVIFSFFFGEWWVAPPSRTDALFPFKVRGLVAKLSGVAEELFEVVLTLGRGGKGNR